MKQLTEGGPAVRISEHIYWVGAVDWALRDFHGYATERGSTYNAYLVTGEKTALVDTVKTPFLGEMLARIQSVLPLEQVDYLISNHAEMDHSGALPQAISLMKPEKVIASTNGVSALHDHFHLDQEITPVKDLESLSLGDLTLTFVEARMLHWPESMMTYVAEDKVLLPNDAFGMHLASSERFADELPEWVLDYEARKYFANILLPLSPLITKALEKVRGLNVPIDIIAPSHGPIWRDPAAILNRYAIWASGAKARKAVIVYDTMWGSTAKMALALAQGLAEGGVSVKVMPLKESHRSDIAFELLDAAALLVGSPTLNNTILPRVGDILTYVRGLKPRNLVGVAFGSYGWSGESPKQLADALTAMKVELVGDPFSVKYVPESEALCQGVALGRQVAEKIMERGGGA